MTDATPPKPDWHIKIQERLAEEQINRRHRVADLQQQWLNLRDTAERWERVLRGDTAAIMALEVIDLPMDPSAIKVLLDSMIQDVYVLIDVSDDELRALPGMTEFTLQEIVNAMKFFDLR